jgi:selenocysteine-specific translation elongation factor
VPLPPHLKHLPYDQLQFTLVDCPGHASLIRTIIGGVQIIDMVLLVIDVTKGGLERLVVVVALAEEVLVAAVERSPACLVWLAGWPAGQRQRW